VRCGNELGAGYADDQLLGFGECYSGGDCRGDIVVTTSDQTPERVAEFGNDEWSVMAVRPDEAGTYRIVFSIEELSTTDFEDIPSVDD
jgi:hypothetical protein